ncbi:MAG: helix-turn-helix domain-containing protein [Lachnospiraceae bacterium]|nr:helix-turn-helix domain-containing protein [Lachnospiraceae bacterium]
MLLRLLNNQIDILEFQKKSAAIDIVLKNGSMYAGVFTIFSDKNSDPSSLLHSMDLCQKTLSTFFSCYVISSNGQDLAVIFQNKTQCPETNFQDLMTSCSQVLADKLGRPVFCALGREVFHIRDLHFSYSDCLAKIEKKPAEKPLKTFAEAEYPLLVQKVLKMARENYTDSNLSLKTLAASMQVNPAYLGREFTIATGEYFNDYINGIRISEAIRLLGTTSLKASKIAESVGFTNASYFFTVFKKITGQSPNDYRCSRHKNML